MASEARLFGRGVAFPPIVGTDGRIAMSQGEENIRENVRIILLTEPGERVMLPSFGAGLKRFLFKPNTTQTHRLIEEAIIQSLGRWEPRIRVEGVTVATDPDDERAALVSVRYTLVARAQQDTVGLRLQLAPA